MKIGVLLVNLGTPDAPTLRGVHRYLTEFLTDPRVIDIPWLRRQLLVRGIIIPARLRQSTASYQAIWTPKGSPLKSYGYSVRDKLQAKMGSSYHIELAMRYREPSIKSSLHLLLQHPLDELIILPLFPQYASATTGSVLEEVMRHLRGYQTIPSLRWIDSFATFPPFIKGIASQCSSLNLNDFDKILISFHGLPKRQLLKANPHGPCLCPPQCCSSLTPANRSCYAAQCHATAHALAKELNLAPSRYVICFQSRLGKEPWIEPYASETIHSLAEQGCKKLLAFCPSFVCDCLETTYEFGVEYAQEFVRLGGESLTLVPGLNDSVQWIDALAGLLGQSQKPE